MLWVESVIGAGQRLTSGAPGKAQSAEVPTGTSSICKAAWRGEGQTSASAYRRFNPPALQMVAPERHVAGPRQLSDGGIAGVGAARHREVLCIK